MLYTKFYAEAMCGYRTYQALKVPLCEIPMAKQMLLYPLRLCSFDTKSHTLLFGKMTDRPAKLRRLEDIRRKLPYLSASALASLIKDFEDQGIPELSQRKHIQEAKKLLWASIMPMAH